LSVLVQPPARCRLLLLLLLPITSILLGHALDLSIHYYSLLGLCDSVTLLYSRSLIIAAIVNLEKEKKDNSNQRVIILRPP